VEDHIASVVVVHRASMILVEDGEPGARIWGEGASGADQLGVAGYDLIGSRTSGWTLVGSHIRDSASHAALPAAISPVRFGHASPPVTRGMVARWSQFQATVVRHSVW
jgi:hypothetical protein